MSRLFVFAMILAAQGAFAEEARFYDRSEEGWFWYQDPPVEPEEPEPEPVALQPAAASPAPPAEPKAFSSEWLEVAIPQYIRRAMDEPTVDNVRAALYLQRIAVDKATEFSDLTKQVTTGDPFLDTEFERPLSNFAAQEIDEAALRARVALLNNLSDEIGVMWFYRTDCPFCEAQAPSLRGLAHSSDLSVLSVSMDGLPLQSGAFPDYVVDQGQSAALGVQTTPSIFVMRPASGEVELIAQGMMELRDMQERILLVARRRGWISEEAWEATRSVRRTTVTVTPETLPSEVLDDPAALVAHLRQAMRIKP